MPDASGRTVTREKALDFRLVDRPLVVLRQLVERNGGDTHRRHLGRTAIHPERIPGLRRKEALENPCGNFSHACVARMRGDSRMGEESGRSHPRLVRDIGANERHVEIARDVRHLGVLRGVRPEHAADDDVRLGASGHQRAQQFLERPAVGETIGLRGQVRNIFAERNDDILRAERDDVGKQGVRSNRLVFALERRKVAHHYRGLATRLVSDAFRHEVYIVARRLTRRHTPAVRPAYRRKRPVKRYRIADECDAHPFRGERLRRVGRGVHRL